MFWQAEGGRLVLPDFGVARAIQPETQRGYHRLLMAALSGECSAGFLGEAAVTRYGPTVDCMIDVILGELNRSDLFGCGDRAFVAVLRAEAMGIAQDRATWHLPPIDTVFVQRKISGTALLHARLKARADVRGRIEGHRGTLDRNDA